MLNDTNLLDYVIRLFNASSAGLKKPVGLNLRWDRRFTRFPEPTGAWIAVNSVQQFNFNKKIKKRRYQMYKIKLVIGCVFLLAATYADAAKYISVSVTQTQTGPDIYITGTNFKPNTVVLITYKNLPLFAPNVRTKGGPVTRTDSKGDFFVKDTEWELNLLGSCTAAQCSGNVTVYATETYKGKKYHSTATLPGWYWCVHCH